MTGLKIKMWSFSQHVVKFENSLLKNVRVQFTGAQGETRQDHRRESIHRLLNIKAPFLEIHETEILGGQETVLGMHH